jgi:hypothetical protein
MFCLCTHGLQFNQCYRVHAVKRTKKKFPIQILQKFAPFSSALYNKGPLRAFPYFSRCAPAKNLNVIGHIVYLLYYGAYACEFVRDGMTLRIQLCQRLCPVFPESRHWDVRHLGVQASSPQSDIRKNRYVT